ncbi:MFS transporter [Kitasatospora arboriphila]|uniref:MFS transporter n=1 Tax=Kitasatospora arboriphila TaxID=258052 RepID=A0ABN1TFI3_9ACTN
MTDTDVRTTALPATDPGRRAWTVTGLLAVFMMINFADKSVLGLAADPIRRELGLSATAFGLANSAFFLLFSISGAAVGLLSDRVRPRRLLLAMVLLWSLAQAPMALGGGAALLVASRILLGAAEGPAFPVAQHTALSWFPDRRRNLPGALVMAGTTLGVVVAAPGLTWVVHHLGWRSAFGAVAVAGMLWAVVWTLAGRENGLTADTDRPHRDPAPDTIGAPPAGPSYRRILATRTWIGSTAAYFGTYWMTALLLVWVPSYLHDGLGYSDTATANLVAALWAVNTLALLGQAWLTGRLLRRGVASRWARARVGGAVLLVSALACLALPAVPHSAATVPLLIAAFGLGGTMVTVAVTTVAEVAPEHRRGGALGLMNAVVTTAGLAAPVLTGHLVDLHGGAGYGLAVRIAGLLLLLGAAATLLVDPARDITRLRSA